MDPKTADLIWQDDGSPRSARFDDPYFSASGGLAEARHVFLQGNDLPGRFQPGFHIGELGFGTGLNMLAAWRAWRESGTDGPLHFTSFEAYPLTLADMQRAHAAWPELASESAMLLADWPINRLHLPDLKLEIILGDAKRSLPMWQGRVDAWFLDGFSPGKNPDLWSAALMAEVAAHSLGGGSFSTYTAAGHVRRALAMAGFEVERRPGFGRKRHMSRGRLAT